MKRPLRVAVIGCGSGGPAAALFLARAGHEVELFERAPALAPVGTGFLLQPTGLHVLAQLGLRTAVEDHGARVARLFSRTLAGRTLLDLRYERLAPDLYGVGMHRATLLSVLADALAAEGVELRCGTEITGSTCDAAGRRLATDDGELGPFDLVVVASGAASPAREWLGLPVRDRVYPWGALWTITPDPERVFEGELYQVVDGVHHMLGLLDTGRRRDDSARTPLVSVFWSVRGDRADAERAGGISALHEGIARMDARAAPLLDSIGSLDQWSYAEYRDVTLPRYHGDRCVVIGDAAHAMSPQLGQGVNLALFDAWVLARCIAEADELPGALAHYSGARRAHLLFYQRATRWLTPFFQSSFAPAAWARDAFFPLARWLPPIERQMLRSMAGLKQGFLQRSLTIGASGTARAPAAE